MSELDDILQHVGVKGMKWGVRRDDTQLKKAKGLALKSMGKTSLKLPNGETISVEQTPPNVLSKFVGRVSPKLAAEQGRTASLSLKDSNGKKIGDAQVYRESKDELNLVWLGVKSSARGRGVGTSVVQASIGYAKKNGIKKLTLEVPGISPDARHIYEKLGFKTTKVVSAEDSDGWGGLTKMEMDVPQPKTIKQSHNLDDILQHVGVKGMKWGVRRNVGKKLDSMKRERQWNKVLKDVDKLSTKDIREVTKRISLENDLKRLSKSKVAKSKDKQDYLRRDKMSNAELSRKVTRLRAKDNLHKTIKDASKEQREFGEKVVQIASLVGAKYAITKSPIRSKDIFDEVVEVAKNPKRDILDVVLSKNKK